MSKQEILSSFCKIVFLIFLIQTTFQSEIKIRSLNLKLNINPVLAEQELDLKPMPYWEGSVRVNGTYNDLPIKGKGYVELVGYSKKYPIIYMQKEDKIFCYSLSIRNTQLF